MTIGGTWTNMPAAVTEIFGVTNYRTKFNLTNASQARVIAQVTGAGAAGSKLCVQYSTDQTTWNYLDASAGPCTDVSATGLRVSTSVNVATAAKNDVYLRVVGQGGNGVADPVFGYITINVD